MICHLKCSLTLTWSHSFPVMVNPSMASFVPGSKILYPSCRVSIAASQRSPSPNSALMSTGASGPSHKTNIFPCKIFWDHRWRWTALGICFPLQPSCFEITFFAEALACYHELQWEFLCQRSRWGSPPLCPSFSIFLILQYTQILTYHPDKALFAGMVPGPLQCLLLGSLISWSLRDAVQIS